MSVAVFVILLPAAVWLLGAVLGLLDRGDRAAALRRIAWRGLPFLGAALLLGDRAAVPALAAVLTALAAHVAWQAGTQAILRRWWSTPVDD